MSDLAALCGELRDGMLRAKRRLDDEVRSYPTPIPRCDAQFNALYDQRAVLARELARATEALDTSGGPDRLAPYLRTVLEAPPYLDDDWERRLRKRLREALGAREAT